jgi:hypothetical protein
MCALFQYSSVIIVRRFLGNALILLPAISQAISQQDGAWLCREEAV